jgi:hypothetical protein
MLKVTTFSVTGARRGAGGVARRALSERSSPTPTRLFMSNSRPIAAMEITARSNADDLINVFAGILTKR